MMREMPMASGLKRFPAVFYRSAGGREPVRDWLLSLPVEDRRAIGQDIATAEFGWPIGMPVCKALGSGLWEIRSRLTDGRSGRVIFCESDGQMVLLHGFVKKTRKAPLPEIRIAASRRRDISG